MTHALKVAPTALPQSLWKEVQVLPHLVQAKSCLFVEATSPSFLPPVEAMRLVLAPMA